MHADADVEELVLLEPPAALVHDGGIQPERVVDRVHLDGRRGSGLGSVVFSEPLRQDDTVEDVLRCFSARHPALHDALWTRDGAITDNLHIMVNHRMIGATHTLRSRLTPGDRLSLLGQFSGG